MTITETIARAIAEGLKSNAVFVSNDLRNCSVDGGLFDMHSLAQPIIADLTEAGFAIVPVTPTEEMLEDGAHCASTVPIPNTADRIYRAMVEAGRARG